MNTPSRQLLQITTTFPNQNDAEAVVSLLLSARLVACGHVSVIQSHYTWEGVRQNETEYCVTLKTHANLYDAVEKMIVHNHPYDVPMVTASAITQVNDVYLEWVLRETQNDSNP